ncbi:Do family serine endopeptidase [Parasedimentitalea marina]|uniref:Probable periplasmic serine endoprotease DegP-like n=1 Tax=Parasedimentitalea marina TaxID=2483033 RepID=A0A3T0N561_9RHOB|nr:Do family serine endopeptidase [Parasedimentitalea marina]
MTRSSSVQPQAKAVSISQDRSATGPRLMWLALVTMVMVLAQALVAQARPESLAPLAQKISPAVVNITTTTVIEGRTGPQGVVPEGSPFEDFFREFQDRNGEGNGGNGQPSRPRRSSALGSGFVISEDGYIVTNNHVIAGADEIEIEFFPGDGQPKELLPAKLIGTDEKTDIALLKVEADTPLSFVTFGDSDSALVGDWVVAMGNPLGQGFSVSAGIVSARNRELSGSYDDYIQTDAAINRGNSGGPLFNMDGEVVGVNTAILSPNGGSIGIGFSMASNVVSKVVDQLKEFGETRRGWLGVRIQDVDADLAEAMGLASVSGALITDVPEGPSKEAGLLAGDVILTFDGVDVKDTRALVRQVGATAVGKAVRVVVHREGGTETLLVTLGRREDAERTAAAPIVEEEAVPEAVEKVLLGLTIGTLTEEMRAELNAPEGTDGAVILSVDEASEAWEKGLRGGDIITEAGQQKVTAVGDFEDRIAEAKEAGRKSLLLLVRRNGQPRFVALNLGK